MVGWAILEAKLREGCYKCVWRERWWLIVFTVLHFACVWYTYVFVMGICMWSCRCECMCTHVCPEARGLCRILFSFLEEGFLTEPSSGARWWQDWLVNELQWSAILCPHTQYQCTASPFYMNLGDLSLHCEHFTITTVPNALHCQGVQRACVCVCVCSEWLNKGTL